MDSHARDTMVTDTTVANDRPASVVIGDQGRPRKRPRLRPITGTHSRPVSMIAAGGTANRAEAWARLSGTLMDYDKIKHKVFKDDVDALLILYVLCTVHVC